MKCTKQSPQCTRCKKHNIDCIYGISLRAGKRASQLVALPEKIESPSPLPIDWNRDVGSATTYSPPEMDPCPSMFEYDMPFSLDCYQGNNYFMNDDTFSPMLDLASSDIQHGHSAAKTTNTSTMSPSPVMSDSVLLLPPAMVHPIHSQSIHSRVFASCNCFRATILTLSTLQQLSESPHTSFDVALVHNKEAIALSLSTLECNCASDSIVILLVASLLAKIINIYQRPCGAWKALDHGKSSYNSKAVTTRLTLGTFNVDEDDEEKLKTEIVRIELRKVVSDCCGGIQDWRWLTPFLGIGDLKITGSYQSGNFRIREKGSRVVGRFPFG